MTQLIQCKLMSDRKENSVHVRILQSKEMKTFALHDDCSAYCPASQLLLLLVFLFFLLFPPCLLSDPQSMETVSLHSNMSGAERRLLIYINGKTFSPLHWPQKEY